MFPSPANSNYHAVAYREAYSAHFSSFPQLSLPHTKYHGADLSKSLMPRKAAMSNIGKLLPTHIGVASIRLLKAVSSTRYHTLCMVIVSNVAITARVSQPPIPAPPPLHAHRSSEKDPQTKDCNQQQLWSEIHCIYKL